MNRPTVEQNILTGNLQRSLQIFYGYRPSFVKRKKEKVFR